MGLMDKITGKGDEKDLFGDAPAGGEDPMASVNALYGLPGAAPEAPGAPAAAPPPPAAPPPAAPPAEATPPAAPPPATAEEGATEDPLDTGLRDLFTESAFIDPQLEALLKKVELVAATDLAAELKEFAATVGMGSSDSDAE